MAEQASAAPEAPLGAHVSAAGGTPLAPGRATEIGATAFQLFTKPANRWRERSVDEAEQQQFGAALAAAGVHTTSAHDSYLINLASPDPVLRARSLEAFVGELVRADTLGLNFLVSHPGNYMDDRPSGLARNIDAIVTALERAPGRVTLLMETTAGSGTALGATFEEIAAFIEGVPTRLRSRVGVCADTAHLFASGYNLVDDYDGVWSRFNDIIGLDRLRMLHLNDSKAAFNSRRDRHELIGEGQIGEVSFRRIMTDPRLASIAKVIETPKLNDPVTTDRRMLERLRSYVSV